MLTEEQISECSKNWNICVHRAVAERFLRELDIENSDYFGSLQKIHELPVSIETKVALEYIIKKIYKWTPGSKGECGVWPRIWIGTDNYIRREKGIYEEGS